MKGTLALMRHGEPTREHWETDHTRTTCASEDCGATLHVGARHHCRKCGKMFCDACSGGGYVRRLDAKADYAARGVFSRVCRGCFLRGNGWFADRESEEWRQASTGHATDRMSDFDRERKVAQAARRAVIKEEGVRRLTPAWRCRTLQQIVGTLLEECGAAAGKEGAVGRATRGLASGAYSAKTKVHWVNDRNVLLCQQAACRRAFTLNERKHHCRVCGQVFCDTCSPKRLDVLEYALHYATEEQLPALEALRGTDEDTVKLERACKECYLEVQADVQRLANKKRLEGSGGHVVCNLYAPIPGYVRGITSHLDKMCAAIAYLDRMTKLHDSTDESEELRQMAAADVLEVKSELLELFKRYEQRYKLIVTWGGWQYYQMLAEGTPITDRDGIIVQNLFMWQGRVCRHVPIREGYCSIVADVLDPTRPGELLFEGAVQTNVEEQLRVLNSLKMYFSSIWTDRYHVQFKALVDGANNAILAASQPREPSPPTEPSAISPTQQHQREPANVVEHYVPVEDVAEAAGHVLVHIIEAAELDLCGVAAKKLNTHVVVQCGHHRQSSHVCKKTANPRWDQKFALLVQRLEEDLITVTVMNHSSELGAWTFGVVELVEEMGGNMQGWVILTPPAAIESDVDQGRIRISVKFMPSEAADKAHEQERQIEVKEVCLLVDEDSSVSGGAVAAVVAAGEGAKAGQEATALHKDDATRVESGGTVVSLGTEGSGTVASQRGEAVPEAAHGSEANGVSAEQPHDGAAKSGDERRKTSVGVEQESTPASPDVEGHIEALTKVYVRVYTMFSEAKKWKGQLDVAHVIQPGVQLEMIGALTLCLEKVGACLQDAVSQGGKEWKVQRQEVLKVIKERGSSEEYSIFPQQERVKAIAASGGSKKLKGVDVLSKADTALVWAQTVLDEGGCGLGVKPRAHEALVEAREVIGKLAHRLAVA